MGESERASWTYLCRPTAAKQRPRKPADVCVLDPELVEVRAEREGCEEVVLLVRRYGDSDPRLRPLDLNTRGRWRARFFEWTSHNCHNRSLGGRRGFLGRTCDTRLFGGDRLDDRMRFVLSGGYWGLFIVEV